MFGDLINFLQEKWEQFWCRHEERWIGYQWLGHPEVYQCKKCGRVR